MPPRSSSPRRTRSAGLIAEIPHDERGRERLVRHGAQALADALLLAVRVGEVARASSGR